MTKVKRAYEGALKEIEGDARSGWLEHRILAGVPCRPCFQYGLEAQQACSDKPFQILSHGGYKPSK